MMPDFRSKSPNDCVPLALSNWFGLDYEQVRRELGCIPGKGVKTSVWHEYVKSRGMIEQLVPRRGQNRMTGIIHTCSKGNHRTGGHLAIIINGRVYDRVSNGLPIEEYKKLVRNSRITGYWIGGRVKKIESPKQQSEPTEDITQWLDDLLGA
jgi:hypothetical protein